MPIPASMPLMIELGTYSVITPSLITPKTSCSKPESTTATKDP